MKIYVLSIILLIITAISGSAYDFSSDGLFYNIISKEEKTVEVTYCNVELKDDNNNGYFGSVKIPDTVIYNSTPYKVIKIGNKAFMSNINLKSVEMPNSICYVDKYAFSNCYNLETIIFSENIDSISYNAFEYCSNLTSITLPLNLRFIGNSAFSCSGLTEITIPENCEHIDLYAFSICDNLKKVIVNAKNILIDESFTYSAVEEVSFASNSIINLNYAGFMFLKKIIFNENVFIKNITGGSFSESYYIEEIVCNISTPPTNLGTYIFNDIIYETCILKVPEVAIELYKNATIWKNFKNIAPIENNNIENIENENLNIYYSNNHLYIFGANEFECISIFDFTGKLISSSNTNHNGNACINLDYNGFIIIVIGNKTFKLII